MVISGVYQIVNTINGKHYIGSSVSIFDRWTRHKRSLRLDIHHNSHLQNAWNKYGKNKFTFSIIYLCENNELLENEQYFIDRLQPEYNICYIAGLPPMRNGEDAYWYGKSRSENTKRKISKTKTGKHLSEEHRRKISEGNMGKRHSEESKRKMSLSMKGIVKSKEHRKKLSEANKGKSLSKETRLKISKTMKLKGLVPANKISISQKDLSDMKKLKREGLSYKDIGDKYGFSGETARRKILGKEMIIKNSVR